MKITKEERIDIEKYIKYNKYTFSVDDLMIKYNEYIDGYYISHSFKKVIHHFNMLFTDTKKN